MGLFKTIIELSTGGKISKQYGLGASNLYYQQMDQMEVNRKLQELYLMDKSNEEALNELKQGLIKVISTFLNDNIGRLTSKQEEYLINLVDKISNANDADSINVYRKMCEAKCCYLLYYLFVKDHLDQIIEGLQNAEVLTSERKEKLITEINKYKECETVIELKNHVINLFKYLDENRINIENKDELINNLNEIEDKIEKVGK